ncbi:MAG TPA: RDD family protein [Thermoanaerobaculia bacterium]|jgi:uncharacterized RDD family membrane protein YckC
MLMCRNHPEVIEGVRRCTRCGSTFCRDCLVDLDGHPYCATCKSEQLMDVRSGVDRVSVQLATFWPRFAAFILDSFIIGIPIGAMTMVLMFMLMASGQFSNGEPPFWFNFIQLPAMFITPLYESIMYSKKNGQTLGKMIVKLRVVKPNGEPITSGQGWGRAWMRLAFLCFSIVDYIPFFFDDQKRTIHDMVAKTVVVQE